MKISVITAVYNRAATVADALRSSLSQTHADVERVVVDGASSDGTLAEVERFGDGIDTLLSEADHGIYDALNKGVRIATGDVVGFLHADDVFADDEALARVAAAMADDGVIAAYGDLLYVSKDDMSKTVRHWRAGPFSAASVARGWMPPHPTLYVRRSAYERLGYFNTALRIAADYDWMLRLMRSDLGRLAYVPAVQVRMRVGGASNASLGNILRKSGEDYRALRGNGFSSPAAAACLLSKNLRKLKQFA